MQRERVKVHRSIRSLARSWIRKTICASRREDNGENEEGMLNLQSRNLVRGWHGPNGPVYMRHVCFPLPPEIKIYTWFGDPHPGIRTSEI